MAHSAGRTFVSWISTVADDERVFVGESTTTGSAKLELGPGDRDQLIGLVAFDGKATILGVSYTSELLATRTQI